MQSNHEFMLSLGGILLLGLATSTLGKRSSLPRVTLLLILGVLVSEGVLDLIPALFVERFDLIANIALVMVGFLLGGKLTLPSLRVAAGQILWISITAAILTAALVTGVLLALGVPAALAVLLGCLASATDAVAVFDVVDESGREGPFPRDLLAIVALDDAWALVIFSLGLAAAGTLLGITAETSMLQSILHEVGGAVMLGLALGLPAAFLTGHIKRGKPILSEALALVFLCGGLALMFEVSHLIASMVMGCTIANLAKHHKRPFHAIEDIEWPLMVIFFVLAGASLQLEALLATGMIGVFYVIARILGKGLGAMAGGMLCGADTGTRNWMGVAMLPQAGVAIGMALVAAQQFPELHQMLLPIVISSTIFFEIIGPVFTRIAILRNTRPKPEA